MKLYLLIRIAVVNNYHSSSSVPGIDFVAVVDRVLEFSVGDSRQCYTIDIIEDDLCEIDPPEGFSALLAFRSGIEPITLEISLSIVVIDDNSEPECGESIIQLIIASD